MGKSRNQRRNSRMDSTDDETMSTTSTGASSDVTVGQEIEDEVGGGTDMELFIDALYEKRAKTREDGLKGLISALKSNVLTEFVEDKFETLLHLCIGSVKKGTGAEIALASQVIGLVAVTTGVGDLAQQMASEAGPYLIKVAKLGTDSKARIAALEALASICFVGCSADDKTEKVMDVLWQISKHKGNNHSDQTSGINKATVEVRATALSAWSVLLSTIPSTHIIRDHIPKCLSTLSRLLESEEEAVRLSAGEAVGIIFETRNRLYSQHTRDLEDASCEPTSNLSMGEYDAQEAELVEQVRALSIEAGGKGQANKKIQRRSFKDILAAVEGNSVLNTSIKLQQGDILALDSWSGMIQLKFLTGVLAEGLQRHLQENTFLHEVFCFVPRQGKRPTLSYKEKRLYMSPNSTVSRARTQNMNRRRSQVYAGQVGHFNITEDDSD